MFVLAFSTPHDLRPTTPDNEAPCAGYFSQESLLNRIVEDYLHKFGGNYSCLVRATTQTERREFNSVFVCPIRLVDIASVDVFIAEKDFEESKKMHLFSKIEAGFLVCKYNSNFLEVSRDAFIKLNSWLDRVMAASLDTELSRLVEFIGVGGFRVPMQESAYLDPQDEVIFGKIKSCLEKILKLQETQDLLFEEGLALLNEVLRP